MLQRPRDLITAHDPDFTSSTFLHYHYRHPYHYQQHQRKSHHHSTVVRPKLVRNCHINSFNSIDSTWNATKAELVTKWKKTVNSRQLHHLKRSVAKKLTPFRTSITKPQLFASESTGDTQSGTAREVVPSGHEEPKELLVAEDIESLSQGTERCLIEVSVCKEELITQKDGSNSGEISKKQTGTAADPMESNRKAGAARQPSHCQLDHNSERTLTPDQYVAIKKQEAVALVMARFNRWFDKRLAVISWLYVTMSYAYEAAEASGNSGSSSGGAGSTNGNSRRDQPSRSTGTKRRLGGDDQDNSSAGGDEDDQNRGNSKRAKKDIELEQKFACPFYKHDPKAHRKHRSCAGPGWPSLHRLKCNETFEDAKDLTEHLRADVLCEKLEKVPVLQGIDEATEAKLKVRKKSCPGMTDEQRWKDIYVILFPNANPKAIPSPCKLIHKIHIIKMCLAADHLKDYDGSDSLSFSELDEWRKVERRIRKELPKVVQKKVERSFEKVGDDVLAGLADIVRDGLFEIMKGSSHDDRSPSTTPAATPRAPSPGFPTFGEHLDAVADEVKDTSLDLSYYFEADFPLAFGGLDDLEFSGQFDFGNSAECRAHDNVSDSGYASTCTGMGGHVEAEA
ncbi:hypothetical protein AAE478_005357 [Parahypoxylon ruwenzoriense]